VTTNLHWVSDKGQESSSAPVELTDFEPGADIFARFNRFGCYLGETEIVWYFNDRPYRGMTNLVGPGPWYMLMDVAVGGLVAAPSDPSIFPAPMYIRGVKVVQYG
jgi:beta-glucanase (GH16 family)